MVTENEHSLPRVDAVVLGASAGAIDALLGILPPLPEDGTVPVIVVVHLPPRGPSALVELFGERCKLRVREARDKEPVSAGIWFAPPDYHLLVEPAADGAAFALSADDAVNFSRPSIDVLFESAADCYGSALAAVVLTGASSDGAAGARAVRDAGGFVVVQDPATAECATMPEAALRRAAPQCVAGLPRIARILSSLERGERRAP